MSQPLSSLFVAPRALAILCAVMAMAFSSLSAQAQGTATPSTGGKHRTTHSAATPPPLAAAPAPTLAPVITSSPTSDLPKEDLDDLNEPPPPTDKATDVDPDAPTQTEILATAGATFASKDRIAVFTGDVRVHDPKFQLASDKLTVFLNKSADKSASPASTPAATPPPLAGGAPPDPAAKPSNGGIDHAIAEGHVIIIQERAATGAGEPKRSVGRAAVATFDNKTGDMVLKGWPSVEQNGNTHVATAEDTVMTLRRDNSLVTVGPSRTVITQRKGNEMPGFDVGGKAASPAPANPRPTTR